SRPLAERHDGRARPVQAAIGFRLPRLRHPPRRRGRPRRRRRRGRVGVAQAGGGAVTRYRLDAAGRPVPEPDLLAWGRWMEGADRTVARDEVNGILVSTVFLGLDHAFFGGPPLLWETMAFGPPLDGPMLCN